MRSSAAQGHSLVALGELLGVAWDLLGGSSGIRVCCFLLSPATETKTGKIGKLQKLGPKGPRAFKFCFRRKEVPLEEGKDDFLHKHMDILFQKQEIKRYFPEATACFLKRMI